MTKKADSNDKTEEEQRKQNTNKDEKSTEWEDIDTESADNEKEDPKKENDTDKQPETTSTKPSSNDTEDDDNNDIEQGIKQVETHSNSDDSNSTGPSHQDHKSKDKKTKKKQAETQPRELTKEEKEQNTRELRRQEILNPKRDPFQHFIHLVSLFAILATFAMAVGQILGPSLYKVSPLQWILRIYVTVICFLMILVELQWTKHIRNSSILRRWVPRGFFYIFIGVLGLEENEKATFRDLDRRGLTLVQTYVASVAWIMIGLGFGYILLGVVRMQKAYNKQCDAYQERKKIARDVRKGKRKIGENGEVEDDNTESET